MPSTITDILRYPALFSTNGRRICYFCERFTLLNMVYTYVVVNIGIKYVEVIIVIDRLTKDIGIYFDLYNENLLHST